MSVENKLNGLNGGFIKEIGFGGKKYRKPGRQTYANPGHVAQHNSRLFLFLFFKGRFRGFDMQAADLRQD